MEKAFWTISEIKFETVDDWNNLKKDEDKRAEWGLVMDYRARLTSTLSFPNPKDSMD